MNKPYSIRIFLPDGEPDGIRVIEKSNWNGIGIMAPRALLAEVKRRDDKEIDRAGAYVLAGPPEEGGLQRLYIGEGDPIRPRLEDHMNKKDFWTSFIAFTSKDGNLNKAHVQHIESRLIQIAQRAKRCKMDNYTKPTLPSMSKADEAEAEGFLDAMLLCFPVLGIDVFTLPTTAQISGDELYVEGKGVKAKGMETMDGFLIFAGSGTVKHEVPSCLSHVKALRKALVENGVLIDSGESYKFSQDYLFSSPSTAAEVVLGLSVSGRVAWKNKNGKTLKEIQDAGLTS